MESLGEATSRDLFHLVYGKRKTFYTITFYTLPLSFNMVEKRNTVFVEFLLP